MGCDAELQPIYTFLLTLLTLLTRKFGRMRCRGAVNDRLHTSQTLPMGLAFRPARVIISPTSIFFCVIVMGVIYA